MPEFLHPILVPPDAVDPDASVEVTDVVWRGDLMAARHNAFVACPCATAKVEGDPVLLHSARGPMPTIAFPPHGLRGYGAILLHDPRPGLPTARRLLPLEVWKAHGFSAALWSCLLYTSDAADE